jgi:hypothetical protein
MPAFSRYCLSAAALLAVCSPAFADAPVPRPPCDGSPIPSYSAVGSDPSIAVWKANDLKDWKPPSCLAWSGASFSAVALAAEFRFAGSMDALLARFGALGSYPSIKYWSTSRKQWQPLVTSAEVVAGTSGPSIKASFDASDFVVGKDNFYSETSQHSARTVYRLRVLARTADHVAIASENVTPIRAFGLTIFEPAALQSASYFDKRGHDQWRFYSIVRNTSGTSRLASGHEASYLNRFLAMFRYMAGIPTDTEPPIAK